MSVFRPMLAATAKDLTALRYPLLASYKLDGIRAVMRDGVLMSRSMKPIPNRAVQEYFQRPTLENFDGELIVGKHDNDVYRRTMSAVMSVHGDPTMDIQWFLFDKVSPEMYTFRSKQVWNVTAHNPRVTPLLHVWVKNADEVMAYHQQALADGYEGLILRDPAGRYKQGRSTLNEQGMLKVKMFDDSEAEILGFVELMHNANEATVSEIGLTKRSSHKANKVGTGKMGALKVRDIKTGVEFEIGTGFTDFDRCSQWEHHIGKIVKYKFFPGGVKDKPRFPVFLGFRVAEDL